MLNVEIEKLLEERNEILLVKKREVFLGKFKPIVDRLEKFLLEKSKRDLVIYKSEIGKYCFEKLRMQLMRKLDLNLVRWRIKEEKTNYNGKDYEIYQIREVPKVTLFLDRNTGEFNLELAKDSPLKLIHPKKETVEKMLESYDIIQAI